MDEREALYEGAGAVRGRFGGDEPSGLAYVDRFVRFVDAAAPVRHARILDVGCGSGWSTLALRRLGHDARGVDLHDGALEAEVPYTRADARALPFEDGSFDVVAVYQTLEHVAEPARALAEARRVLRRGGRLVVVGPNLESPALAARFALAGTPRSLLLGPRRRRPGMPRHPYGNVPGEWWGAVGRTLAALAPRREPRFAAREPDARPPFHADNDAAWLCNPADLLAWGRLNGMRPVRWWSDRPGARLWWRLAGGTWVVLERDS